MEFLFVMHYKQKLLMHTATQQTSATTGQDSRYVPRG